MPPVTHLARIGLLLDGKVDHQHSSRSFPIQGQRKHRAARPQQSTVVVEDPRRRTCWPQQASRHLSGRAGLRDLRPVRSSRRISVFTRFVLMCSPTCACKGSLRALPACWQHRLRLMPPARAKKSVKLAVRREAKQPSSHGPAH